MLGEFFQVDTTVDEKGRLILPARLRKKLTGNSISSLVLMYYPGMAIFGFTPKDWEEKVVSRVSQADFLSSPALTLAHGLIAGANSVDIDGQGRVLLPPKMRAKAGLGKNIVLQSFLGRIEIWDADRWAAREAAAEAAVPELGGLSSIGKGA